MHCGRRGELQDGQQRLLTTLCLPDLTVSDGITHLSSQTASDPPFCAVWLLLLFWEAAAAVLCLSPAAEGDGRPAGRRAAWAQRSGSSLGTKSCPSPLLPWLAAQIKSAGPEQWRRRITGLVGPRSAGMSLPSTRAEGAMTGLARSKGSSCQVPALCSAQSAATYGLAALWVGVWWWGGRLVVFQFSHKWTPPAPCCKPGWPGQCSSLC